MLTDDERERADARRARACRRPRAGDRHDHAFRHRASAPSAAGGRRRPGAAMVMVMPPYHGATIRVAESGDLRVLPPRLGCDRHPDHDPGRAGRRHAAARRAFLARMAREIEQRRLLQDRDRRQAAAKLRELIALGGDAIDGPWDGEEAITLMADLDAGATGAMTGGGYPGRHPPDHRPLLRRRPRGGGRRLRALAAADQLREPAMRAARPPRR